MSSSRHDLLYLVDIVEAADAIALFIRDADHDAFVADDLLRSAVLNKLQIIGEAAAHVSETVRAASEEVPWKQIVGFRNFTVHTYFAVDWTIVWTTATDDAPLIGEAVRSLIASFKEPG